MKTFLIVILASSILLGCSSTPTPTTSSLASCQQKNWQEAGEKVAIEGKSIRRFDAYIEQCGDSLPSTAKEEFIGGYIVGIVAFCTYESGYERGHASLSKSEVSDICPLEVRNKFAAGYSRGRADYRTQMHEFNRVAEEQYRNNTNVPSTPPVGQKPGRETF